MAKFRSISEPLFDYICGHAVAYSRRATGHVQIHMLSANQKLATSKLVCSRFGYKNAFSLVGWKWECGVAECGVCKMWSLTSFYGKCGVLHNFMENVEYDVTFWRHFHGKCGAVVQFYDDIVAFNQLSKRCCDFWQHGEVGRRGGGGGGGREEMKVGAARRTA